MEGSSARLYLDAIGAHVVARVSERSDTALTVSRELPFLKLGSSVLDDNGRAAEVSGVSVVIEDGTPRLVLELAYAAEIIQVDEPRAAATVPFIMASGGSAPKPIPQPAGALPRGNAKLSRGEDTLLFVTEQRGSEEPSAPGQGTALAPARSAWRSVMRLLGGIVALFMRGLRRSAL